mmetsp:Transcript_86975/g.127184  ORF Transcript_86975/g.127184 Transcript_86975/m.127184 type:complete len:187 (-) Transcript_86975:655-1215(-)
MCVENVMQFFDLENWNSNTLKCTKSFSCAGSRHFNPEGCGLDCTTCHLTPWVPALNKLFDSSPRHFHLINEIATISIACDDLASNANGPHYYRCCFQGIWDHPDSGSVFTAVFHETMTDLCELAANHAVAFGSDEHIKAWANVPECNPFEQDLNGLGKIGSRLLYKASPTWVVRHRILDILAQCNS